MPDAVARYLVAAVVVATVFLEVAALVLGVGVAPTRHLVLYAIYAVVQAVAGAIIVWTYPRHRIGWLLAVFALVNALFGDAALAYGQRASAEVWPGSAYAEILALSSWIVAALGLTLLFLLFPDGHLHSRRWRWVPLAWAVGAVLAIPGWALSPRLGKELSGGVNPLEVDSPAVEGMYVAGAALVSGALVASVVALLRRFRRARGVERQQLKWVMLAGSVLAVVLPLSAALWTAWPPIQDAAAVALVLLPVAMCIAVVRHHLYDIDLVISRTVGYAALTGVLAGTYAAIVLAVGAFFSSPVAAAAAALVVAVVFRPLHHRIQDAVDRRFRRARHESLRLMTEFVDLLRRGGVEADAVEQALRAAVDDDALSVALRSAGSTYDVHGRSCTLDPVPRRRITTVDTGHQVVTLIRHRVDDESLVAEVIEAGRLALEIAGLQVELRRRLEELDASRARIVAVAEEERRRIARDLHDGSQQRLVSVGLGLRHVQHALQGTAPPEVDRTLDGAVAELGNAIEELRELAGGLRPASLDDGLASALNELAARSPIPVEVRAVPDRFHSEIEAAAYFIACEGLTNAVKHAKAGRVVLEFGRDNDDLVLSVTDDGNGGADLSSGGGLLGLADRARAHRGSLVIESPPGAGTRLTARLQCG